MLLSKIQRNAFSVIWESDTTCHQVHNFCASSCRAIIGFVPKDKKTEKNGYYELNYADKETVLKPHGAFN